MPSLSVNLLGCFFAVLSSSCMYKRRSEQKLIIFPVQQLKCKQYASIYYLCINIADSGEIGRLSGQIGHPVKRAQGVARGWQ